MLMTIKWNRSSAIIAHLDCGNLSVKLGMSMRDRGQMVPLGLVGQNPLFYCVDCCRMGVFVISCPINTQQVPVFQPRVDGDGDND